MPRDLADKNIIDLVFGTRPNIIKAAGLYAAWRETTHDWPFSLRLIDTGQHWDDTLSHNQRIALGLPEPACNLGVGPMLEKQRHSSNTPPVERETVIVRTQDAYEHILQTAAPSASIAIGDVNGSVGIARAAVKHLIPVFHLEAGLRGGSDAIAEEANRHELDHICTYLWAPDDTAYANLQAENISTAHITITGNIMIDALRRFSSTKPQQTSYILPREPVLVTLHRVENLANPTRFDEILTTISQIAQDHRVVWPLHPRTRSLLEQSVWSNETPGNICLVPALAYPDFMTLLRQAKLIITDSGGILEECAYLGKRTVILRPRTERPHAMAHCGFCHSEPADLIKQANLALQSHPTPFRPPGWDGNTGLRMLQDITSRLF
ncbi:UDP-N-acetyl glucosamine 2-epimerase [Thalassospira sp. TSL5-1]|uniref:UDP-N-acetyl glucosamine 2-epimerase n=1 Tax=Thalassospira sp. TSL5-1 TaxID=1544451 RepID=UPI00093E2A66|nr:UDP-N-acetylglucosamine 2-epimerase [Thalassospira sp. TSL5-1]OKH86381.1 hypothetical protein LF95_23380 [Thalassospira sp. TSL5-1]